MFTILRTYKKTVMFIAIGVCLGLVVWFSLLGRATRASQENFQGKSNRPTLSKLPEIKSCVEHVKLVNAKLGNQGDSQVAVLELENQAYVGVISISVETIVDKAKYSVVKTGFSPDKEPLIIIPPREKASIEIGNLAANSAIKIASVMFSDGTEEGCASSLKTMHEIKDHDTKKGVHKIERSANCSMPDSRKRVGYSDDIGYLWLHFYSSCSERFKPHTLRHPM